MATRHEMAHAHHTLSRLVEDVRRLQTTMDELLAHLDAGEPATRAALRSLAAVPQLSPDPAPARGAATPESVKLTAREVEVLRTVGAGASNRVAGRELGISEKTVKNHLGAIFGKLDVRSRTEAVFVATQLGLLEQHCASAARHPGHATARSHSRC